MHILIIEPFHSGSHAAWAAGYARHSRHRVEILSLPGRYWKWRMQGAAVELADGYRKRVSAGRRYDLILASDMLDLAAFRGLTTALPQPPTALYFHENQLAYPPVPGRRQRPHSRELERERWFGFINFTSALAADACFFNSSYHRESFFQNLPGLLKRFPDFRPDKTLPKLRSKSEVLYLGLDLKALERLRPDPAPAAGPPLILWNHRWDYDKDPDAFCRLLLELLETEIPFEVTLLGQESGWRPASFSRLQERLGPRLRHCGFVEDDAAYAAWLWRADLLPVTSRQDFFGISVVEAIFCGCRPLLPDRLAYPEHIPVELRKTFLYQGQRDLKERLLKLLSTPRDKLRRQAAELSVEHYDWSVRAPLYDRRLAELACERPETGAGGGFS